MKTKKEMVNHPKHPLYLNKNTKLRSYNKKIIRDTMKPLDIKPDV